MGIIYKLIIRLRDYEGSWTLLYRTKAEAQAALDRICDAMRTGERIIHLEKNPPRGAFSITSDVVVNTAYIESLYISKVCGDPEDIE